MSDWLNPSDDVLDARSIGFAEGQQSRDEEVEALTAERDALAAEIARLRRLEAALPKTADGVYVIPGSFVYHPSGTRGVVPGIRGNGPITLSGLGTTWACIGDCYSTSEAAEAAREAEKAMDA